MEKRKRNRKISRRMSLQRKRRAMFLSLLIAVCVIFVFTGSYFALRKYVTQTGPDVICNNIYIGTANVSGMTAAQAKEELKKHLEEDQAAVLTMNVEQASAKATLEELGLKGKNVDKLLQKAVEYGKKGSMWSRYRQMKKLEKKKLVFEESFLIDPEAAAAILNERALPLAEGATDASITKVDSGFQVIPEKEGKTVDIEKSIEKISKYLNKEWEHSDFSLDMVSKVDQPRITGAELSKIQDELGSFSTNAGGGDRWQNLKTGVEKLNGVVIMPGEELSVYQTTAPYDEEHGYVQAGAYENGQVVDAYGGGICQVSTTLYNAVIYAELEIVKRAPHSMTVAYVEPSRDAAIAGDYLDLVFKNTYDAPVYIFGEIDEDNLLRFAIYGQESRPENRSIEFESETLSTEDYGITYKENPEASLGSMEYTGSPHAGKEARLWKVVYEDGEEVSREVFNTSSYSKSNEIIEVGTASRSAKASGIVSSAIASQNGATIENAIAQANALLNAPAEGSNPTESNPTESNLPEDNSEEQGNQENTGGNTGEN